jgi:hypothetical protein
MQRHDPSFVPHKNAESVVRVEVGVDREEEGAMAVVMGGMENYLPESTGPSDILPELLHDCHNASLVDLTVAADSDVEDGNDKLCCRHVLGVARPLRCPQVLVGPLVLFLRRKRLLFYPARRSF